MEIYDADQDERLQPNEPLKSQSSSSSGTSTTGSPNYNYTHQKNRKRHNKDLNHGNAVLFSHMNPNKPDIVEDILRGHPDNHCDSDSDSDASEDSVESTGSMKSMKYENRQTSPSKSELQFHGDSRNELRDGQYHAAALPGYDDQSTKAEEEHKSRNQNYNYRDRTLSITSSQDSVKSQPLSWIKRERANTTDLSVDNLRLQFIQGSPEHQLNPLTNARPPSRQVSGDVQSSQTLPSIHNLISSDVVPRMAEVSIPQCSTPISLSNERSPSSTSSSTLSRRNTFSALSAQSPQDILPFQNRRPPHLQRIPPRPRLLSTSSGSTTTTTSGRSGSTSTSRTESNTPRSLPTPSDNKNISVNSPQEQSPPEASLYPVSLVGYTCNFSGCTAAPFQTQYLLNSHKNVHSSERPHYCPVNGCKRAEGGKGFKRKNEMIRHGLVHSSPGYVCPYCPDRSHTYPRPDNLQRHVSLHHKDKDKRDPSLRDVLAQRPPGMGSTVNRRRRA